MSMKSQNRLPIFSLVILGVTALTIFGLNYVIEQISLKQPVAIANHMPPPSLKKGGLGIDDSIDDGKPGRPKGPNKFDAKFNGMGNFPNGMPPPDMRRLQGGKDAMDLQKRSKRTKEAREPVPPGYPPPAGQENYNELGPPPSDTEGYGRYPEDDRGYRYPDPPYPYDDYPPPPSDYDPEYGYPPLPPDYDPEDYYNGEDYEGKLDLPQNGKDSEKKDNAKADIEDLIDVDEKTADLNQDYDYDPYPDEEDIDEYLDEYLEEDD